MGYVYPAVRTLEGKALIGSGDCVELIKHFAPGLIGMPTAFWKQGAHVIDVAATLRPGTAIATFVNGRYPQHRTGQHAAFFVRTAGAGIWVIDQWKGDPKNKPTVSMRHIPRRGRLADGSFINPSNNAEAFFVIER